MSSSRLQQKLLAWLLKLAKMKSSMVAHPRKQHVSPHVKRSAPFQLSPLVLWPVDPAQDLYFALAICLYCFPSEETDDTTVNIKLGSSPCGQKRLLQYRSSMEEQHKRNDTGQDIKNLSPNSGPVTVHAIPINTSSKSHFLFEIVTWTKHVRTTIFALSPQARRRCIP